MVPVPGGKLAVACGGHAVWPAATVGVLVGVPLAVLGAPVPLLGPQITLIGALDQDLDAQRVLDAVQVLQDRVRVALSAIGLHIPAVGSSVALVGVPLAAFGFPVPSIRQSVAEIRLAVAPIRRQVMLSARFALLGRAIARVRGPIARIGGIPTLGCGRSLPLQVALTASCRVVPLPRCRVTLGLTHAVPVAGGSPQVLLALRGDLVPPDGQASPLGSQPVALDGNAIPFIGGAVALVRAAPPLGELGHGGHGALPLMMTAQWFRTLRNGCDRTLPITPRLARRPRGDEDQPAPQVALVVDALRAVLPQHSRAARYDGP